MTDWLPWNGGPCPVDGDVRVEVKLWYGLNWYIPALPASKIFWDRNRPQEDWVKAYRIVKEE